MKMLILGLAVGCMGAQAASLVVTRELRSAQFANNPAGVSEVRRFAVYLPPGYDGAARRYPVVYFLPNPLEPDYRSMFDKASAQALFDRAIESGRMGPFLLVCPEMTTPLGSSWYVNSPVTGGWENFLVGELVPYIDSNFRTLASRDSRGIAGVFMGGYGAIRIAMRHADVFGAVYALHPVGTGSGVHVMDSLPRWDLLENAKSMEDVKRDGVTTIFTSIFQAHLPNPQKPPLYIDLPARRTGTALEIDAKLTERLRSSFFLEEMIPQYADALKSLRGIKFDWSRADGNYDHVYSNHAFTHKLNEFGIVHEAEEYNGAWGDANWGEDGRIYNEVLPFFARKLVLF